MCAFADDKNRDINRVSSWMCTCIVCVGEWGQQQQLLSGQTHLQVFSFVCSFFSFFPSFLTCYAMERKKASIGAHVTCPLRFFATGWRVVSRFLFIMFCAGLCRFVQVCSILAAVELGVQGQNDGGQRLQTDGAIRRYRFKRRHFGHRIHSAS